MKTIDPIDQMRPETPELEPEWSASSWSSWTPTPTSSAPNPSWNAEHPLSVLGVDEYGVGVDGDVRAGGIAVVLLPAAA